VFVPQVASTASIDDRAQQLRTQVFGLDGKVNLVGHSMGGLDARHLISRLDGAQRVVSLTTVATPHRGSAFADWVAERIGNRLLGDELLELVSVNSAALHNLTRRFVQEEFNPETPDHPDVAYFSYGAAKERGRMFLPLRFSHRILAREEGANDGLVSVRSSHWGTYLGTLEADHLDTINWGQEFDARHVYRLIARLLAEGGW
jgi:triacylglycerol lipase